MTWQLAPLAAFAGIPALVALVWARFAKRRHQMLVDREAAWLIWHWYSGGPLETHRSEPTDNPDWRAVVAASRTTGVASVVGIVYLWAGYSATPQSLLAWSYGGAVAYGLYLMALVGLAVRQVHRRTRVLPFYWAIQGDAGWKPDTDTPQTSRTKETEKVPPPRKIVRYPRLGIHGIRRSNKLRDRAVAWLHRQRWHRTARLVARCWHPRLDGVVVRCAPTFKNWEIKHQHVSEDALAKLGHKNVKVTPLTEGDLNHFQFLPGAVLPADVRWTDNDVRALMESRESERAPLLGCGHNDMPARLDWALAPHVAISAGTGGGKSTEIAFIAAQVLFHGGIVTVLDVRQNSHPWARDLVGVRYARKIGDIYDTAMDLDAEVTRRGEIAGDLVDGETANWQRHLVVIEELNTLRPRLNNYYRTQLGGPQTKAAPALDALTSGIFMGRDLYMNCLIAAQRFQDKLLSGPARDMFYARLLARWEQLAWKDLAKGDYRAPDMHPGRAVLCYGADEDPIQMGLIEHPDLPETAGNVRRWLQMPGSRWVGLEHGGVGRQLRPVHVLSGEPPDGHHDRPRGDSRHISVTSESHQQQEHDRSDNGEPDNTVHDVSIRHHDIGVKGNGVDEGRENHSLSSEDPGVMGSDPQPLSLNRSVHPQTHSPYSSGSSLPGGEEVSMEEIDGGSPVSGRDGGIEYSTLSEIAALDWCPYRYGSLKRWASEPDEEFPDPVNPGELPRRFSERAVQAYCEDRQNGRTGPKEWGLYVVRPPGSATVKIGYTGDMKARLRKWNLGEHCVLRWIPRDSKGEAYALEQNKHDEYADYHDHLEWYWIEGDLARWLGLPEVVRS